MDFLFRQKMNFLGRIKLLFFRINASNIASVVKNLESENKSVIVQF